MLLYCIQYLSSKLQLWEESLLFYALYAVRTFLRLNWACVCAFCIIFLFSFYSYDLRLSVLVKKYLLFPKFVGQLFYFKMTATYFGRN